MDIPSYAEAAKDGGYRVRVWVQPGAKQDAATGVADGRLRVKLKAPAVDNKANAALVLFLSKLMGVPRNALEISAGQTGRKKTIRVAAGHIPGWGDMVQADTDQEKP
jgi:uncharacterized protein